VLAFSKRAECRVRKFIVVRVESFYNQERTYHATASNRTGEEASRCVSIFTAVEADKT